MIDQRILITGSSGYLGSRISRHLRTIGAQDLVLGTRRPTDSSMTRLDLLDKQSVEAACQGVGTVIHLAGLNEQQSREDPEAALMVNAMGTLRLLQAAERAGVKRVIYFSTVHVYGTPLPEVMSESTVPRPLHPYAITNKTAEDFVLGAHAQRKIEGISLRLSNGMGEPAHPKVDVWSLVVNDLCRQALRERKLTLKSAGLQRRNFMAISDVAAAVTHFLKLPSSDLMDGLFNLGGPASNSLQIIELAQRIAARCEALYGYRPPVDRPEPKRGEVGAPLTYKIDKLLTTGFKPSSIESIDAEIDGTLRVCERWGI